MIHSILPVQIMCLAIFLHNLSPRPLWSTSWFGAFHLIFHTFLRNTCPCHHKLFCCSTKIILPIPTRSLNTLLGTLSVVLTLHIHLTILISACWNATSLSFLTSQVSLPCSILLRTKLLYSLPLLINDVSLKHKWLSKLSNPTIRMCSKPVVKVQIWRPGTKNLGPYCKLKGQVNCSGTGSN